MKIYVGIYEDNDGPANGILLTQLDGKLRMNLIWTIANRISWIVRHMGLRHDNAQEWVA